MSDHNGKSPDKQHWGDMSNDYQKPEQQKQPLASVTLIQKQNENDKNVDEIESSLVSFGEEAAISVCLTSQSERLTVSRLTGGYDLDSNSLLNR